MNMTQHWIFRKADTAELKQLKAKGQYSFNIDPKLNKREARAWLENSFGLPLRTITTHRDKKKSKRRGRHMAYPIRHKTLRISISPQLVKTPIEYTHLVSCLYTSEAISSIKNQLLQLAHPYRMYSANLIYPINDSTLTRTQLLLPVSADKNGESIANNNVEL
jgi:ribosomal protein L23